MGFGNFPMINILSQRLVGNPRNWENSQHLRTLDLVVVVAVLRKCGMERRLFTCSATRVPDPESRSVRTVPYRVLLLATVPVDLLTKMLTRNFTRPIKLLRGHPQSRFDPSCLASFSSDSLRDVFEAKDTLRVHAHSLRRVNIRTRMKDGISVCPRVPLVLPVYRTILLSRYCKMEPI